MTVDKRYYSEKEAADLVVRAAKLQEKAGGDHYTPGISFEELEKMATEAGIDPTFLQQAVMGTPSGEEEAKTFLGIPLSTEFERVVEFELPPESFDVVSDIFPQKWVGQGPHGPRMTNVGQQVGRSLMMQISRFPAHGQLKMTSRNGRTRITTKQTMFLPFMIGMYPGLFGAFISLITTLPSSDGPSSNPMIAIPVAIAFIVAGLSVFVALSKAGQKRMREVTDMVADRVQEEGERLRSNLGSSSAGVVEADENLENRLR